MALDDLRVDDEAGADVVYKSLERGQLLQRSLYETHTEQNETGIGGQVELGNADTADSAIVLVKVNTRSY